MNNLSQEQLAWLIDQDYTQKHIDIDEYYRLRRLYGLPSTAIRSCPVCGSANTEQATQCFRCSQILLSSVAATQIKLKGIAGPYAGQIFVFQSQVVIGRDPNACNLVLPEQAGRVSRKHASITFDPATQAFILQNHSHNGTFIMSPGQLQQIECWTLRPGDQFCFANIEYSFEFSS